MTYEFSVSKVFEKIMFKMNPYNFASFYLFSGIYDHVMEGDPLKAIECSLLISPDMFESRTDVLFDLLALYFVELVRAKNW